MDYYVQVGDRDLYDTVLVLVVESDDKKKDDEED